MDLRTYLNRLLPMGTSNNPANGIEMCPAWPPDLFAVAASLISSSGAYASARYAGGLLGNESCFDAAYISEVDTAGQQWSRGDFPGVAQLLWNTLLTPEHQLSDSPSAKSWHDAAMKLLAIADVASAGFGFGEPRPARALAKWVFEQILAHEIGDGAGIGDISLPYLPVSICIAVPPEEACVQPKTRTPQVGCTLRALSHNLALLPSVGDVKTQWRYAAPAGRQMSDNEPFNILLIPFPYAITGSCFRPAVRHVVTNRSRHRGEAKDLEVSFFSIEQQWLKHDDVDERLARFVHDLIKVAEQYVERVHGVVFPELALTEPVARYVASRVADRTGIELFISGIAAAQPETRLPRNQTYCEIFSKGRHHASWLQSKHHRWKLDRRQIERYNLSHVLSSSDNWFEEIDVAGRECSFHVFREGASLAVLVCEDLARVDPVQSVVRSIGPNLVITLLMDGPQIERRWPGRYATVLADDPGSAVLTLTSMGLMRRVDGVSNQIALWKDPEGGVREILLPDGCHGVTLSLTPSFKEEFCSDWRSDDQNAMRLSLAEVFAVKLGSDNVSWLNAR